MARHDQSMSVSPSQDASPRTLTRGDLAAILILLFVAMLAVADKYRARIERLFGGMASSGLQTKHDAGGLQAALHEALLAPPARRETEGLFDGPSTIELRGTPVWLDGTPGGVRLTFSGESLFESGTAVLHQEGRRLLEALAAFVRPYPNRMEVVAYVAAHEAQEAAYDLSWQRASAVVEHLERRRIERARLRPAGAGRAEDSRGSVRPADRIEIIVEAPAG